MSVSGRPASDRGNERLLWDCATIGRSLGPDRPSARARLEADLGEDITRLLLATLRESEPSTPHEEELKRAANAISFGRRGAA